MQKEVFDKQLGAWLTPEEEIKAIKKRAEAEDRRLTGVETEQLGLLERGLKEQQTREREITQRNAEKTAMPKSPEAAELRKKADAAREEEKKKFQGGQYL